MSVFNKHNIFLWISLFILLTAYDFRYKLGVLLATAAIAGISYDMGRKKL